MLIRCRAWPDKHADQHTAYKWLASFIPLSLISRTCSITSLVQSQNALPCIPSDCEVLQGTSSTDPWSWVSQLDPVVQLMALLGQPWGCLGQGSIYLPVLLRFSHPLLCLCCSSGFAQRSLVWADALLWCASVVPGQGGVRVPHLLLCLRSFLHLQMSYLSHSLT